MYTYVMMDPEKGVSGVVLTESAESRIEVRTQMAKRYGPGKLRGHRTRSPNRILAGKDMVLLPPRRKPM